MKYVTRLIDANANTVALLKVESSVITVAQIVSYKSRLFVYKANWSHDEITFREVTEPVNLDGEINHD